MENDPNLFAGKVGAILIALGSASFVVTIYHLIILCRYHQHHHHVTNRTSQQQQQQQQLEQEQRVAQNALELPQLIPSHKYEKKKKNNGDEDDMCAVCLGDFEEGEELRTLPECMHTFHVPCIDPWLYSHSSCPVCRTLATPSPAVVLHSSEHGSGSELNAHQHTTVDIVQISVVQNRLAIGQILI